jgi:hypothetical protein
MAPGPLVGASAGVLAGKSALRCVMAHKDANPFARYHPFFPAFTLGPPFFAGSSLYPAVQEVAELVHPPSVCAGASIHSRRSSLSYHLLLYLRGVEPRVGHELQR